MKIKGLAKIFLIIGLILFLSGVTLFIYLGKEIDSRFASRKWSVPSVVFSDSVLCFPGQRLSLSEMKKMLLRRWYREVSSGEAPEAGEFFIHGNKLKVHLRRFDYPGYRLPERIITISFKDNYLQSINTASGELPFLELEPIEIARLFGK